MNRLIYNIKEYVESVFCLKSQGKDCLCPIDNPIVMDLVSDKILYYHYKRGDTVAITARIEEALDHFCCELDNQATGNWIYDLTTDLTLPAEDD